MEAPLLPVQSLSTAPIQKATCLPMGAPLHPAQILYATCILKADCIPDWRPFSLLYRFYTQRGCRRNLVYHIEGPCPSGQIPYAALIHTADCLPYWRLVSLLCRCCIQLLQTKPNALIIHY